MAFRVRGPGGLLLPEEAAPATPASGEARIYVATNGTLHLINDAGVDVDLGATGGGSSPSQGTMFSNDALGQAVPASRVPPAVNGSYFVPIRLPAAATLTGLRYRRGAGTTAGNVIGALYDAAGTRVAISGTVAQGIVASAVVNLPFTATYAAAGGLYWAHFVHSAATNSFFGWATNDYLGAATYVAQATFAAPATFVPPATTVLSTATVIPWMMTY